MASEGDGNLSLTAIRRFLDHPDGIIFVGSGISRWAGLPSWAQTIEELADFLDENGENSALIRREASSGDLLQAASYGFSRLTPVAISKFIRNIVRFGSAKPGEIHKAIVELGPSCYITTNYDNLIEQALARWQPDAFYPAPITNAHLAEIADILSARSSHFIFKPHGDAADAASIVLTREQYRMLLPDGDRHRALEALKTLLVTRPVLYLGFGLRDPDFIYLRDLLLNIYVGSTRDHYAIMPDICDDEADYWRRQYGIRLFGYQTHLRADGSRDHRELQEILEALVALKPHPPHDAVGVVSSPAEEKPRPSEAERILALTRYTAGLLRLSSANDPIEIRVSSLSSNRHKHPRVVPFENWTATRFLTEGPSHAILIGLPGAGKTFALHLATTRLAQGVQRACLDDTLNESNLALPVLIDLKLYDGDLRGQIDAALPAGFGLEDLLGKLRLKLFLDAFNEMPSMHLEDGTLLQSLERLRRELGEFDYVITSRTTDALPVQSLPQYELARVNLDHVDRALGQHGIILSGHFKSDIRELLSRPFFLRLVTSGSVSVPEGARPGDIHASYLHNLRQAFADRFLVSATLIASALSHVAHRALDAEREAFPLSWLTDKLLMISGSPASAQEMVNWLIARGTLIPYSGGRISFVHQSITEYCAAIELARLFEVSAFSFRDTITLKKWDQCLFLALGLLEKSKADEILDFLTHADLALALSAARHAESDQSTIISGLLAILVERGRELTQSLSVPFALARIPLRAEHVPYLEEMLNFGGLLASQAIQALATIHGPPFKFTLLELLDSKKQDFNFSSIGIAPALKPLLDESDLPRLLGIALDAASMSDSKDAGYAVGILLAHFDPDTLIAAARDRVGSILPPGLLSIVCEAFCNREDKRSFEILSDLILKSNADAVFSFYLRLRQIKDSIENGSADIFDILGQSHVQALWEARLCTIYWSSALHILCCARPDLSENVKSIANTVHGIERIALLFCLDADADLINRELMELASKSDVELEKQRFDIFRLSDLDWANTGVLYPCLLARGIERLTGSLLGTAYPCSIKGLGLFSPDVLIPVVDMAAALQNKDGDWWQKRQIGSVVAVSSDQEMRQYLLDQLTDGDSPMRHWIKITVLPNIDNISTDDMSDEAIAFLLADLSRTDVIGKRWNNALGHIATHRFVMERLIPLTRGASNIVQNNLRIVLEAAGDRHGRRYLLPS